MRVDPTTRSTGFGKTMRSFNDQNDTLRATSKERDPHGAESIWEALG